MHIAQREKSRSADITIFVVDDIIFDLFLYFQSLRCGGCIVFFLSRQCWLCSKARALLVCVFSLGYWTKMRCDSWVNVAINLFQLLAEFSNSQEEKEWQKKKRPKKSPAEKAYRSLYLVTAFKMHCYAFALSVHFNALIYYSKGDNKTCTGPFVALNTKNSIEHSISIGTAVPTVQRIPHMLWLCRRISGNELCMIHGNISRQWFGCLYLVLWMPLNEHTHTSHRTVSIKFNRLKFSSFKRKVSSAAQHGHRHNVNIGYGSGSDDDDGGDGGGGVRNQKLILKNMIINSARYFASFSVFQHILPLNVCWVDRGEYAQCGQRNRTNQWEIERKIFRYGLNRFSFENWVARESERATHHIRSHQQIDCLWSQSVPFSRLFAESVGLRLFKLCFCSNRLIAFVYWLPLSSSSSSI